MYFQTARTYRLARIIQDLDAFEHDWLVEPQMVTRRKRATKRRRSSSTVNGIVTTDVKAHFDSLAFGYNW